VVPSGTPSSQIPIVALSPTSPTVQPEEYSKLSASATNVIFPAAVLYMLTGASIGSVYVRESLACELTYQSIWLWQVAEGNVA
jgi:hypothetical protein